MKLLRLFPVVFAMLAVGCAAQSSSGGVDDEGQAEASADLTGKKKHFYAVGVSEVSWAAGCGVVRPDMPPCPSGLFMTYEKSYIDLTFDHTEHVDNAAHTLTIKVDSWSYDTIHPMIATRPETIQLSPRDLQMGQHYDVKVEDRTGKTIYTTTIATFLAE